MLECDVVAGTDGFHGVSRGRSCQRGTGGRVWERTYPYAWLGILADAAPATDELIYAWHPDGFALYSMRSPKVSRLYLQVDPAEKIEDWSDDRIWDNLATRFALDGLGGQHRPGHRQVDPADALVRQRADAPRPAVPGRRRRAHRAADRREGPQPRRRRRHPAGHRAGPAAAGEADATWPTAYSDRALARVWRCTHFSWYMTSMLHRSGDDFDAELQLSQLRRVVASEAAARELAENYTGLPLDL